MAKTEEYVVFLKQFCVNYDKNIFSMKYRFDIEPTTGFMFCIIPFPPGSCLRHQLGAIDIEPLAGFISYELPPFLFMNFPKPCVYAAFLGGRNLSDALNWDLGRSEQLAPFHKGARGADLRDIMIGR